MSPVASLMFEQLESRLLLSSVTIITHGFNGNTQGWVSAMADAVAERTNDPSGVSIATMNVVDTGGPSVSNVVLSDGPNPFIESYSGDLIIKLEWGSISGGSFSTGAVAASVADYLLTTTINGISFIEAPIHMIGHSRGGSLIAALAQQLGRRGVWVDHLTFLDPHPVDGVGGDDILDFGDTSMRVSENVVFADNYFRQDGFLEFVDFDGEPVSGAFNVELDEDTLGGFFSDPGYGLEHSDTHLWYFGTVDESSNANNGEETVPTNWYSGSQGPRNGIGFAFSAIAGGSQPASGVAFAHGGTAPRVSANAAGDQWPNVRQLTVMQPDAVERGGPIQMSFTYQDRDSAAVANIYLDTNGDPLDGNEQLIDTVFLDANNNEVLSWTGDISSEAAIPGTYHVLASIDDGQRRRHQYAENTVMIVDTTPPLVMNSQINNGVISRSMVSNLRLHFSEDVDITSNLHLENLTTGTVIDAQSIVSVYDEPTATNDWTFPSFNGGSLPDGNYRATLNANGVVDIGGNLLQAGTDWNIEFFRLFGDSDGDRDVDSANLFQFRQSFGLNQTNPGFEAAFDADANGIVDAIDLFRFRGNFGIQLAEMPPESTFVIHGDAMSAHWAAVYWAYESEEGETPGNDVIPIEELLGLM